jgi:hypothetical protein
MAKMIAEGKTNAQVLGNDRKVTAHTFIAFSAYADSKANNKNKHNSADGRQAHSDNILYPCRWSAVRHSDPIPRFPAEASKTGRLGYGPTCFAIAAANDYVAASLIYAIAAMLRVEAEQTPFLGSADSSDPVARQVAAALDAISSPDPEVAAGLDAFLAEPIAPTTKAAAIDHILRDRPTGHGYLGHRGAADPFH